MNIKRIGYVILAVKDLDTSIKFYYDILGMPIKNERRNWVDLGSTGAILSLHPASITAPHSGTSIDNGVLIGLTVGDLNSAIEELREKGVKIYREIQERDAGKNAIVLDPWVMLSTNAAVTNNVELGTALGKLYAVSAMVIHDPGDSDILESV